MKIFITKATLFTGKGACNKLIEDHIVIAIKLNPEQASALFEKRLKLSN